MTRRAPLPKITECVVNKKETVNGIGRGRLLRGAYPFFVICALCLAHIQLQFARVDMQMQESQLQGQQRMLQRELAVLERQSESIDIESLRVRARRDLDMQELRNPTSELLARIPASIEQKYSQPLTTNQGDVMVAEVREARKEHRGLAETFMSLFESDRAMAAVYPQR